jgi:hypothetical protein
MLVIISSGEAVRVVAWSQHFSRPGRAGFCQPGSRYASQGLWRGLVEVHGKAACPVPRSLAPKDYAESVRDLPRAPKQNSHKRGLLPSAEVGPGVAHLTARFVLSRVVQSTLTGEKSIPPEPPSCVSLSPLLSSQATPFLSACCAAYEDHRRGGALAGR